MANQFQIIPLHKLNLNNNRKLFALQTVVDGRFYARVLKRRNELEFALDIFKKGSVEP